MRQLSHERLVVYQRVLDFLTIAARIVDGLKGHKALADQLRRASLSVVLNIAEAAGKPSPNEARHHFAIARGSALECAAALDVVRLLGLADGDGEKVGAGRRVLVEIVAMLSVMCRSSIRQGKSN